MFGGVEQRRENARRITLLVSGETEDPEMKRASTRATSVRGDERMRGLFGGAWSFVRA